MRTENSSSCVPTEKLSESYSTAAALFSPNLTPLKTSIREKLKSLTIAQGELILPCVPALLDEYIRQIQGLLHNLGQTLQPEEITALHQALITQLEEGFRTSPNAHLIVSYKPPIATAGLSQGVKLDIKIKTESLEDHYHNWIKTREGPLFGSHPDAKVIAIASHLGNPANVPILDIGAGVGRNTLALARQGYPVDAIELTPEFAQKLAIAADAEELPINVIQGNILDPMLRPATARYKLAVIAEVVSHFREIDQVRLLLAKVRDALQPDGWLLFSTFLAVDGYEPDEVVRQLSQTAWSYILTRTELQSAMAGLSLEIVSDESVFEYEQQHLPKEAWPPTPWFRSWTQGRDLFPTEASLMELRWILCQRR
jgi:2-polyprenyl-3-methyl-5-hydroxy-6-metoxy-1,4-benzoquinol methylase